MAAYTQQVAASISLAPDGRPPKAGRLDAVARGVLAQAELGVELPGAVGEGALDIL